MTKETIVSIHENIVEKLNSDLMNLTALSDKTGIRIGRIYDVRDGIRELRINEMDILIEALDL